MVFGSRSGVRRDGLAWAAIALVIAILGLVSWARGGHVGHLVSALGFLFLVPGWYLRPVTLATPFQEALPESRARESRLGAMLSFTGMLLVVAGLLVRWLA